MSARLCGHLTPGNASQPSSQSWQACVLRAMFTAIGTRNRHFVEVGFNEPRQCTGSGSNTDCRHPGQQHHHRHHQNHLFRYYHWYQYLVPMLFHPMNLLMLPLYLLFLLLHHFRCYHQRQLSNMM